ncbi:MAG: hypothetical protein RLZZ211_1918 [Bacteroidota bacterium]|jgi:hypothetical protein
MVSAQNRLQGGHKKACTNLRFLHSNHQNLAKKKDDFFCEVKMMRMLLLKSV